MIYQLDGREFTNKEATYNYLIERLPLPDHTGHNLDALWDVLTDCEPLTIEIYYARDIFDSLEEYGRALLDLLGDLNEETHHHVIMYW